MSLRWRARAWLAIAALPVAAGAVSVGCNALTGIGDLQKVPDCGDDCDAGAPIEPETDACVRSGPEICTDGIDNDCNGTIDCADPACGAFVCGPPIPSGWRLVALDGANRGACPPGFAGSTDLVVDPDLGPATCTCTCAVDVPPSCVDGPIDAGFGNAGCGNLTVLTPPNDGGCTVRTFNNPFYRINPLPVVGGSCAPKTTVSKPPLALGRACDGPKTFGAGCGAGVCAPSASAPYRTCIAKTGAATCPKNFPTLHKATTSVNDTRQCETCGCGAPTTTCTDAKVTVYTDTLCTTGANVITADGTCRNPSPNGAAYRYTATANATCTVIRPPVASGDASVADEQTICCP